VEKRMRGVTGKEKRGEIGKEEWRVAFWNVAGLRNKDRFLEGVGKLGRNCVVRDMGG